MQPIILTTYNSLWWKRLDPCRIPVRIIKTKSGTLSAGQKKNIVDLHPGKQNQVMSSKDKNQKETHLSLNRGIGILANCTRQLLLLLWCREHVVQAQQPRDSMTSLQCKQTELRSARDS